MAGAAKKRQQAQRKANAGKSKEAEQIPQTDGTQEQAVPIPQTDGTQEQAVPIPQSDGTEEQRSRSRSRSASRSSTGRQSTSQLVAMPVPKNIDLPSAGWYAYRNQDVPTSLPPRQPLSTMGAPIKVGLNTFRVQPVNIAKVYQFEVLVGNGTEKRGLIKSVWNSNAVKSALGPGFLFDGERLAWSKRTIDREVRLVVDLDAERGRRPSRTGKENKHRIVIRQTTPIRFDAMQAYMAGKCSWDNSILEVITFLDHLLREWPSSQYTAIKRSFFQHGEERFPLGGGIEAFKGIYQSMRIVHGLKGAQLSVNLDVANGTFWSKGRLVEAAVALCGARDPADLTNILEGGETGRGKNMSRFKKLRVVVKHRGGQPEEVVIDRILYKKAREFTFEKDGKNISLYDYYARTYNIRLNFPDLPLVKITKGKNTVYPMELLSIEENRRYQFKLDERQTSNMIRVAVQPPAQRWKAIEHGLGMLDWRNDPFLKDYGVQIDTTRTTVDARLLPAPTVKYGTGEAKPGTSGRWDLKNKKFLAPNPVPLKSWSVCIIPNTRGGKPDLSVVRDFITKFIQIYQSHGGRVENKQPALVAKSHHPTKGLGDHVTEAWSAAGNQANAQPQMLVFILPDKDLRAYQTIKRSADVRYGVVSQCMQYSHVQKCQAQYMSNVCMKFNAKLGGVTCRAVGPKSAGPTGLLSVPTMIIGADVSHAAPGQQLPSTAALTMSMDKLATRYMGLAETNGHRVEMIQTSTFQTKLKEMMEAWLGMNGGKLPSRIFYFRDGVSEGQYQHVLQQEVQDMKTLVKTLGTTQPKFVVVIGSKRHHVRFFPEKGDRNGNAFPGTLVETGVTHPFENDFYLCGHAALKGTARPMHYHVLLNEANISNAELHTLIYEHGYQYARSTTPVSQFPAIYYAHIVSNRAAPHSREWSSSTDSGSGKGKTQDSGSTPANPEFKPLLEMAKERGIRTSMWYI